MSIVLRNALISEQLESNEKLKISDTRPGHLAAIHAKTPDKE